MAGALRKTMVYLGLAEDELGYDEYDDYDEPDHGSPSSHGAATSESRAAVTTLPQRAHLSRVSTGGGELSRITTIHPRTYNEAKTIGEHFRDGVPVIMNLTDMNDADAKRLVDFAAGLVFGLHGSIERVTSKVFLLSPEHVEVSSEDTETVSTRAVFNQS
jgi:cell division inhibitor SepF